MLDPREFGALIKRATFDIKVAFELSRPAGYKPPAPPKLVAPKLPTPPAQPTRPTGPIESTWGQFGGEMVNALNPFASKPKGTGVFATADKWYNPWTQNKDPMTRGEEGLMRTGQAAMGVGATAGLAAGGIAAAPYVAATGTQAATTAGAMGTAAATQAPRLGYQANRVADVYNQKIQPMLDRTGYSPDVATQDGVAALSGNFDKITGPGVLRTPLLPGSPSSSPLQAASSMFGGLTGT